MRKIYRILIFFAVFLAVSSMSFAASFDVKVTPINDKIIVNEVAEFEIAITNNLDTAEEFVLKKTGYPFWDMYTKPIQNPISVIVQGKGRGTIRLFVDPIYITTVDTYTLDAGIVKLRTGEEVKAPITVGIKSTDPLIGGYIPTVATRTSIEPESIDPREEFTITIVLSNQNILNYSNLTIKVESKIFQDELHYPLGPKEDRTIEIRKKADDMTPPQKDNLVIAVFQEDKMIVNPIVHEFEIKEYVAHEQLTEQSSFLKARNGVKVTSNSFGYKGTFKLEMASWDNLFTSTKPRADYVKEGDKNYLVWELDLGEKRAVNLYYTKNYRLIVVILALAAAAIALYFLFRSPIVVSKGIGNVSTSEGAVSSVKVVVRVKNRSNSQITNIEVIDNLPHIAHVEKEIAVGSMQPHAILKHPKRGMVIKWTIDLLEAGDERVLSYKMKSRLPILGEFNLPSATARCTVGGKIIISNSNRATVSG